MNTFDLIQARLLLPYEVQEISDDTMWVTDGLNEEAKRWFQIPKLNENMAERYSALSNDMLALYPRSQWPVLIQAPTGRGKNWFTIRCLANYARSKGCRILLLTNRSALTKQQRLEAAIEFNFPDYGQDVYDRCCIWGNVDIINYHNVIDYLFDPNNLTKNLVALVVFDEAHFFCSDSPYNSETSNILQQVIKFYPRCKHIYMSATPDEVKDIIALEELRGYINYYVCCNTLVNWSPIVNFSDDPIQAYLYYCYGPYNQNVSNPYMGYQVVNLRQRIEEVIRAPLPLIKQYVFKSNYDHINLHFFYDWAEIKGRISLEESETENSTDRWLIFVSKKEEGKKLKKEIGSDSFFVYSDSERAIGEETEDSEMRIKLNEVISNRCFEEKIMISTTVLYNGISLVDPYLKNIVVDTLSKEDIVQMAGRKRCRMGEKLNLYIRIPTVDIIKERIKRADKRFKATQQYLQDPNNFFYRQWKRSFFDPDLKEIFDFRRTQNGVPAFVMSEYAPRHFAMESGNYSKLLKLLESDERPHAIEEEISSWFDKEFSEDMQFGKTHYDIRSNVLDEANALLGMYVELEHFDVWQCEQLWQDLKKIVMPNKGHISDANLSLQHNLQTNKEQVDYSKMLTDIRKILTFCELPYKVYKDEENKRSPDRSKWKYHCDYIE